MMVVAVTGGRLFKDVAMVARVLGRVHEARGISLLVNGQCAGLDRLARAWAIENGISISDHPVLPWEWARFGPTAGPLRNQRMIDLEKPRLVVAFPGGNGTADMVRRAKRAGIEVMDCRVEEPLL